MTQNSDDVADLHYCETCKLSDIGDSENHNGEVSTSQDGDFKMCKEGHKLFPTKCELCGSTWKSFVREETRVLCLGCDYPVHVFDQPDSPGVSESRRLFTEAPGFLVCGCCEQFDLDLFTLLPIDDTHVYFQCLQCFLEMVVASRNASPGIRSRFWSRLAGSSQTSKYSEESFMAYISQQEFNKVLNVARARMVSLEQRINEVSPMFASQVADPQNASRALQKSSTLTNLIDGLIVNDNVRDHLRDALKKLPAVSSTLLSIIVTAQVKNPTAAEFVNVGSKVVIETTCNIILGQIDKRYDMLKNSEENNQ